MIKKLIFSQMFTVLEALIEEHWDEIVAKGKEYALQLLATFKAKLLPEESWLRGACMLRACRR